MQPEPLSFPHKPRAPREPMLNLPRVIVVSIVLLIGLHAAMEFLDPETAFRLILRFGFVPALWTVSLDAQTPRLVVESLNQLGAQEREWGLALAAFVFSEAGNGFWSALTYAFLHGSWTHVLLNCLWLAAFGTPIARRCGTARFLAIAAITAIGGMLAHWATHPYDVTPMIGASGAVSGMMGAAIWFVFAPVPWGSGAPFGPQAHLKPRERFGDLLRNRNTLVFFLVWFALNFLFGVAAEPFGLVDGGIAWEAHVGGFLAGLAIFPWFDPAPPARAG